MSALLPGARLSPYEIGLPGRAFRERVFREIRDEGEASGAEFGDPGVFLRLEAAGRAVHELRGDAESQAAWSDPLGAFLFQAFHFRAAGEPLYVLDEEVARYLAAAPAERFQWRGELPVPAGYLQLPRHLFWSPAEDAGGTEPVDGFFWTLSSSVTLSLLVAMGIRRGRPGFSLTELPPAKLAGAGDWLRARTREEGADFAPMLPGGDLGRLHSIITLGEVLKLVARVFAYISGEEGTLTPREAPSAGSGSEGSTLPFRRIRLPEGGGSASSDRQVGET